VGSVAANKKAYSWDQFSHLFEGPGVPAFYMAERVTHQLGKNEDVVPMLPLQFTLFPYEAPDKVILLWWAGIPMLDRLDKDGDFEEYQQSLMPTLFPHPVVSSQYLVLQLEVSYA
jgi:hypothetical protein